MKRMIWPALALLVLLASDVWASPGNIASAREVASSDRFPAAMREQARGLVARMEASPGRFVTMFEDGELRLDAVREVKPDCVGARR